MSQRIASTEHSISVDECPRPENVPPEKINSREAMDVRGVDVQLLRVVNLDKPSNTGHHSTQ